MGQSGRVQPASVFKDYTDAIWAKDQKHDVILIDGGFCVSCFFSSVMRAAPGSKKVLDDYYSRPHYHVVEEFLKPALVNERQAIFTIPQK